MEKMLRSFLPIGQGAFYTEQFDNGINIVYDCGSGTSVKIIEQMIRTTFNQGETIHAVFISHLHSDHINGLEMLLTYCNVLRIYLPYLTPADIVLAQFDQQRTCKNASKFSTDFISDPQAAIVLLQENCDCTKTEIVFIPTNSELEEENLRRIAGIGIHRSGESAVIDTLDSFWKYIPFTFNNSARRETFLKALEKDFRKSVGQKQILDMLKNEADIKILKNAYEHVSSDLNTTTMTVYSGPADAVHARMVLCQSKACICDCYGCTGFLSPGCLYLGDYNAKKQESWEELDRKLGCCWTHIGVIQVPHHGSDNNFNQELLSKNSFLVISAGAHNKFYHPHAKVLKSIITHNRPFAWVTEAVASGMRFEVRFWK